MKAALIGCGRMGAFSSETMRRFGPDCWFPLSHADAIVAHPQLELSALCDANEDSLRRAGEAFKSAATFSDHRAMLDAIKPDIVCIATRTIGRHALIADCIEAGVRALHVEKPLCNSTEELSAIAQWVSNDEIFLTLGAVRRHMDIYRAAVQLVNSGEFGQLVETHVNLGAGALYWAHPHSVDLALMAAGDREISGVQAILDQVLLAPDNPRKVLNDPTVMSATIWFEDGSAAHIGRAPGHDFVMACENGVIEVKANGGALVVRQPDNGGPYFGTRAVDAYGGDGPQGTFGAIKQLVDCLSGNDDAIATNKKVKRDVVLAQRVLFACVQSHFVNGGLVSLEANVESLEILAKTGQFFA